MLPRPLRILLVHDFRKQRGSKLLNRLVLKDCRDLSADGHQVGGYFIYGEDLQISDQAKWLDLLAATAPEVVYLRRLSPESEESLRAAAWSLGIPVFSDLVEENAAALQSDWNRKSPAAHFARI